MSKAPISIELSSDEAIIFFEFLSRYSDTDRLTIEDQAEQRVLWNMCCNLEKILAEPFLRNYRELLQAARNNTRDSLE